MCKNPFLDMLSLSRLYRWLRGHVRVSFRHAFLLAIRCFSSKCSQTCLHVNMTLSNTHLFPGASREICFTHGTARTEWLAIAISKERRTSKIAPSSGFTFEKEEVPDLQRCLVLDSFERFTLTIVGEIFVFSYTVYNIQDQIRKII